MTLYYPLVIKQGESWGESFPVLDATGRPVTVDGWTARGQIRRTADDPLLHEWSATFSNLVVSGTTVAISLPLATTRAWTWRKANYDLELTDPAGNTYRLAEGPVRVIPEITHT